MKPNKTQDKQGAVIRAGNHTYGDTGHIFVERKNACRDLAWC